jgi:hypothetical protein
MRWPDGFMWGTGASATQSPSATARTSSSWPPWGCAITGYYEWLHGFDVQFGIIDRDRSVRPSALVLRREATGSSTSPAS